MRLVLEIIQPITLVRFPPQNLYYLMTTIFYSIPVVLPTTRKADYSMHTPS
jgi:hypothetical protein